MTAKKLETSKSLHLRDFKEPIFLLYLQLSFLFYLQPTFLIYFAVHLYLDSNFQGNRERYPQSGRNSGNRNINRSGRQSWNSNSNNNNRSQYQVCRKTGHIALDCWHRFVKTINSITISHSLQ